jgi:hypothetical protein
MIEYSLINEDDMSPMLAPAPVAGTTAGTFAAGDDPRLPPGIGAVTDLATDFAAFAATITSADTYVEPDGTQSTNAIDGISRLIQGRDASSLLTPLGFTLSSGYETVSRKPYALAKSEYAGGNRKWGWYLADLSAPLSMVIEAPHPGFDTDSEQLALKLWQRVPGAVLLMAGAHRNAAAALADVAHQTGSLFHQVAAYLSQYGAPQVQIHGFADASDPGIHTVISSGDATAGPAIKRVADLAVDNGLVVHRGWLGEGSGLQGTTNTQGDAANTAGTAFIHVETSNTLRTTPSLTAALIDALAGANVPAGAAHDGPQLASAVSGQFPVSVGTANTVGASPYAARASHIHRYDPDVVAARDSGLLGWTLDPATAVGSLQTSAGVLHLIEIRLRTGTVNTLYVRVGTAGATLTASQNFLALFDSTGARVGLTADQSTAWTTTGTKSAALTTPYAATGGVFYVAILSNGTTQPTFIASSSLGQPNFTRAAPFRAGTLLTGQTSIPSSVTLGSSAALGQNILVGAA